MHNLSSKLKLSLLVAGFLSLPLVPPAFTAPAPAAGSTLGKKADLHQAMRKLWEDHITWTRLVIVSTAAGLPDLDATTARLLQNQTDIGNAIKSYYGDAAGDQLTKLLRDHIIGAADILAQAKANDQVKLGVAKNNWYANGEQIAAFLSAANPKGWPAADMKAMMRTHLDLTLSEAVNQLQGHYPESVADYDKVHVEILQMADMLSAGIIQQFPKKF